jgi:single-strand DNA-binding protein
MPSINRVTLMGNLGRDPELRYTQGGIPVCNASLATTKSWKEDGEWKQAEKPVWHKIVAWRKLAEALGAASKGDEVFVDGELTQKKWENKEGVTQYTTEILAGVLVVMGKGHGKPTEGDGSEGPPPGTDDDVPF